MDAVLVVFFSSNFDKAAQGLAGEGRRLANELGAPLHALVLSRESSEVTQGLTNIADAITVAEQPALATYQPETYLAALTHSCNEVSPRAVLLGNDTYSQE